MYYVPLARRERERVLYPKRWKILSLLSRSLKRLLLWMGRGHYVTKQITESRAKTRGEWKMERLKQVFIIKLVKKERKNEKLHLATSSSLIFFQPDSPLPDRYYGVRS